MKLWLLFPSNRPVRSDPQVLLECLLLSVWKFRVVPLDSLLFTSRAKLWFVASLKRSSTSLKELCGILGFDACVLFALELKEDVTPWERTSRFGLYREGSESYHFTKISTFSAGSVRVVGYIVIVSRSFQAPRTYLRGKFSLNIDTIVFLRYKK